MTAEGEQLMRRRIVEDRQLMMSSRTVEDRQLMTVDKDRSIQTLDDGCGGEQ